MISSQEHLPALEEFTSGRIKSLGWKVLEWGSTFLGQPDGRYKGQRWEYTNEQALFILRFYALDEDGTWRYRRAVLERPKGHGKSPLLAAICCTEMLGPVRFDGWDEDGEPIGIQAYSPLVQIAAISDSQADNTMILVGEMLAEGEAINEYPGLDIMLSKVTAPGQRKIEKVTASPRGREGNRATFIVMDETHLWVPAEHGPQLADALRRNAAKMGARTIETTNAHVPGEESVAEGSYNAYLKGLAGGTLEKDILFDTKEANVVDIYDREQAFPALKEVYGDAADANGGWVPLERIWAEINDPDTKEHTARRFYFNEKTEGKSTWLAEPEWRANHDSSIELSQDDKFALGFKGAVRNGATSLLACRLRDNALFVLGLWEKPDNAPPDWEVDYASVDTRIRMVLAMPGCTKLVADPENWQEVIGRIAGDFPDHVEELWLSRTPMRSTKAVEQFETAAKQRRLKWADLNLSRHVLQCHTLETPQGILIRKETVKSKRYISAAQAAVLALESAVLSVEEGALVETSNEIYSF